MHLGERYMYLYQHMFFQGQIVNQTITPSILTCDESRPFWISWDYKGVYAGKGNIPPNDMIMSYNNTGGIHTINAISLSTGWGATGDWQIPVAQGKVQIAQP